MIEFRGGKILPFLAFLVFRFDVKTLQRILKGIRDTRSSGNKSCQYHTDRGGFKYLASRCPCIDCRDDVDNATWGTVSDSAGHKHQFFYLLGQGAVSEDTRIEVGKGPAGLRSYCVYDLEHPWYKPALLLHVFINFFYGHFLLFYHLSFPPFTLVTALGR